MALIDEITKQLGLAPKRKKRVVRKPTQAQMRKFVQPMIRRAVSTAKRRTPRFRSSRRRY